VGEPAGPAGQGQGGPERHRARRARCRQGRARLPIIHPTSPWETTGTIWLLGRRGSAQRWASLDVPARLGTDSADELRDRGPGPKMSEHLRHLSKPRRIPSFFLGDWRNARAPARDLLGPAQARLYPLGPDALGRAWPRVSSDEYGHAGWSVALAAAPPPSTSAPVVRGAVRGGQTPGRGVTRAPEPGACPQLYARRCRGRPFQGHRAVADDWATGVPTGVNGSKKFREAMLGRTGN